jgi:hypothetical protein
MKGLFWREYRRNRLILAKAVVVIPLPHIVVAVVAVFWPMQEAELASGFFGAYMVSTAASALMLAALAANSTAPDYADRSGEFVSYLPFSGYQKLACKLLLPLTAVIIICVVNLAILMPPVETWPIKEWPQTGRLPDRFQWSVLLISSAIGISGVTWFVSSIQSSVVFAMMCGLVATFLVAGPLEEADFWFPFFPVLYAAIAIACYWFGGRHYLHENEPYQMPAWFQKRSH